MGQEFEATSEVDLDATPDQIWDAIATGPGIDSWFMGRNEVQQGEGGHWRMTGFGEYSPTHRVTEWEPGSKLRYATERSEDGRFNAYEFLIEGREQGSTTLRMVTSGFLPGDDWEDEYDAMTKGGALFFATLATYLTHFPGRAATPVTAFGPMISDWQRAWATLRKELGLSKDVREGDRVRCAADGIALIDGAVYFANDDTIGVRTHDGLYRFLKGFGGPIIVGHHIFSAIDQDRAEQAWQAWLHRVFA